MPLVPDKHLIGHRMRFALLFSKLPAAQMASSEHLKCLLSVWSQVLSEAIHEAWTQSRSLENLVWCQTEKTYQRISCAGFDYFWPFFPPLCSIWWFHHHHVFLTSLWMSYRAVYDFFSLIHLDFQRGKFHQFCLLSLCYSFKAL